ncbi:signal peptidase II [Tannockella kyphosi]|uniref:signal peptidase II n=1 Tax=Tannockella kyphosi TaxID=2899121 RepID=UPI00201236AF|nr:signal peptidase II [Tannockella kyphosi]
MKKFVIDKKSIVFYLISIIGILVVDQLTKVIVEASMQLASSHTIIDKFFYFTYAQNKGAAWSMLEGHVSLFILIGFVAGIGMIFYFLKTKENEILTRFGLVLAFAGMIGNVIDRVRLGYVVDFIDFIILGYDFPIFNVADMALVIGLGLVILEVLLEGRNNG